MKKKLLNIAGLTLIVLGFYAIYICISYGWEHDHLTQYQVLKIKWPYYLLSLFSFFSSYALVIIAEKVKKKKLEEVIPQEKDIQDFKVTDSEDEANFAEKLIDKHYSYYTIPGNSKGRITHIFSEKTHSLEHAYDYGVRYHVSNSSEMDKRKTCENFLSSIVKWHSANYGIEFPIIKDVILNSAAPDMLEALKSIENDDNHIPKAIWEMRNKAIAKAENHK